MLAQLFLGLSLHSPPGLFAEMDYGLQLDLPSIIAYGAPVIPLAA